MRSKGRYGDSTINSDKQGSVPALNNYFLGINQRPVLSPPSTVHIYIYTYICIYIYMYTFITLDNIRVRWICLSAPGHPICELRLVWTRGRNAAAQPSLPVACENMQQFKYIQIHMYSYISTYICI